MDGPSPTTPSSHASVNPTNTNTMSSDASNCSNRDMAWEWGECRDVMKKQCVWCKICSHKMSGGITRPKQHLTHTGGQVKGCPKVTVDIQKRVMASIKEKEKIKLEKKRNMQILSSHSTDLSNDDEEDQDDVQEARIKNNVSKKKKFVGASNTRGPMDGAYSVGLPFNAVRDEGFQDMINVIGEYGRGMPTPSYHNIRVTLMKKRLEETKKFVDSFRPHWEEYRCSIMSDFWTDGKGRCLINFLVNCPIGTIFLKSIDASEHVKNAQLIVEMINEVIEDVGEANILQFITDNGSNFKAAGKILEEKHPKILVDTEEKPSMGYIYDAVDRAKEQIKKNVTDERLITKLWGMIQTRWSDQLHHPLHAARYYLNPVIFHGENSKEIKKNRNIVTGLYVAIDRLVPDDDENDKVRQDLNLYIDSVGQFGSAAAIRGRKKVAPYIWWRTYGIDTPLLQTFAISILSQTCSASPCERNWSTFDNLHSKKRNCLLQQKLNDLVFIQYNTRLQRRYKSLKANKSLDPILLRDVEENDDWVTPTEVELQEFVDGTDGLLWSVAREAMGGNEEVGPSTKSKSERYIDDDDDDDITVEVNDLEEQLDGLIDVDSEDDFIAYD
ncbi:hypothetical protein L1987_12484 [Smallanthus sonchifolius]|uniref:Uncharacterized protein n=1 Tax=Smallanthus sonchifolius TaxID=185202 RepID=A0ACB9JEC1_9ASTR|nr:hypothetical protein L1987_12484 [Smallanthus sonchifolius]